ncbi:MAG: TonB-dependent receptor [Acidobacteriota bacterium]
MKVSLSRPLLVLLAALLVTTAGYAQRQTGSISGRVLDAENNPLPGATVSLSGPAMMGTQDFVSSETGAFRFAALSPGRDFELKVALPGFKTVIRPGLIVGVGRTTEVDIVMEMSTVSEEVTVTAPSPVVDVQATKTNVNYSAQFLASLPMNRDLYDIQNSIPGAISEGVEYRRTSSILGGTVRSQLYALDGVPLNDPATNYSMANINVDVYEEIEFETGGHPAEVGQTDSTYVNIVTKSGGNKFSGGVTFYYANKNLAENLISDEQVLALGVNPPEKFTDYKDLSLNLGGPVIKDRLWFFVNGRRLTYEQANPLTPENRMANLGIASTHYDMNHQEWLGFGKLTFQITPKLKYFGMLHYNHLYEPVYNNSFGSDADFSYTRIWDHENTYTTTHQFNWIINQDTFLDIRGTYVWRNFPLHSRNEGEYTYYDNTQKVYWGTAGYNDDYIRKKTLASVSATRFQDDFLGASHEFKAGFEFEQSEYHRDWYRANPYYSYWANYATGNPYYYNTSTRQGRLRIRTCPDSAGQWDVQDHIRRFSGYLQDSARTGRWTINVGLRLDYSYQYEPPQSRPELRYNYGPELLNPVYGSENPNILLEALIDQIQTDPAMGISPWDALALTQTKTVVSFTTLSPRLGVVYDVFGNGKTAIKASFGRYYEPVWASKYNGGQIFGATTFDFRWNDRNANGLMDLPADGDTYVLSSYQEQDPTFNYYAENLKTPYTMELSLGVDQELAKDFRIGGQFLYKISKNIVDDVDMYNGYDPTLTDENGLVWLPYDATDPGWDGVFGTGDDKTITVYGLRDDRPVPTMYGVNPAGAKRQYWAGILTFDKRMSHRWQFKGSILYGRFKGNCDPGYSATEGESTMFDDPNTLTYAYGSVSFDRPFQLKLMGTYVLPYDIIISAYLQARSGSGWGRTFDRVYFPSGFGAQSTYASSIRTEPDGSRWTPSYTNLDLRLEKEFVFAKKVKLSVYADVFNLAGRSGININENPYARLYSAATTPYQTLSTTYKQITSVYGVRSVRLGARVTF